MTAGADRARAGSPDALAIRAGDLARRFGARWALRGVDLTVEWSRAVALVGSNGAGKTTLLRILAGALTPSRGEAWVGGRALRGDAGGVRSVVGLLTGDAYLYEDLTAAENLSFALGMCGRRSRDGPVAAVLERVGLGGAGDRRVRAFSSGMRKRLALARVLVVDPPVLLLDEPYANLDEEGADLVDRVVTEARNEGRAVILVTHRVERAAAICDETVRLAEGRRVEEWAAAAIPDPLLGVAG